MQKVIASIIIGILCFGNFISCSSKNRNTLIDNLIKTEGWIDENTYRIVAEGKALNSIKNKDERKESAKRAAKMNAWFKILKKFKNIKNQDETSTLKDKSLALDIQNIIKNGFIIDEIYDEEENCEIIYEIYQKNLKEMVMNADLSDIEIIN